MAPAPQLRPRYGRIAALSGAVAITALALAGGAGWVGDAPGSSAAAATERPVHVVPSYGALEPGAGKATRNESAQTAPDPLPAASGTGKRVVFDMSAQRVWLVDPSQHPQVERSYLVSGSLTDNLRPGSYTVYSRSRHAIGVDDSGTMDYMVRFAHGDNAAIGFHDVPVKDGHLVQARSDLGSPQSHGCIRQWRPDAKALWAFAPVGTAVVVVA